MSGLFTVLIAEKEHIDAIQQENTLFFEPFLESKDLALCYWDPAGQSLQDSVPGLYDVVGRRKEWRAVILRNDTAVPPKTKNPFDVVDYSKIAALKVPNHQPAAEEKLDTWEESWNTYYRDLATEKEAVYRSAIQLPLQKLTTWLCYKPENYIHNDVQDKQDIHEWALGVIGDDACKPSVKLELLEKDQYKWELRLKEKLRKEFVEDRYLNVNYPAEVYCISPRASESNYFDPDTYWNIREDSRYSSFADRNMYFDRTRFMVFDMLAPSHRNFRTDYIRFLATVMIFVSNPIPGSAMQARRLYQLEAESDDTPLCTLVTSYDRKLAATSEVVDSEMEKIRNEIPGALSDKAAEELFCTPMDVPVLLDESCDSDSVYAEKDYGLFFDSPENEFYKWNRDYRKSEKALGYILKQQPRAVRKSVSQTRLANEISNVNVSRLTPLQIDDIRDYTDNTENEMIASIPPDMNDTSVYTQRLKEESEQVKKVIGRRMTKKTVAVLSAICVGLYLLCFLPFLFSNTGTTKTVTTAIILSAAMCGALAIIILVTLFFLRKSVLNAIRGYNNAASGIMGDVQKSMKQFSKYLSASGNVRRGHAVINHARDTVDDYTKSLRIRKKHQEDIRRKRAQLAECYGDYIADRSFCDETMSRPYDYDFDQATEYPYPAPFLAGDRRQIEFICAGNMVTVPSSYVKRILVRLEGIYED